MRSRRLRAAGGAVGLGLVALVCLGRCTGKSATEARALEAAHVFRQLIEIESANLIPVATSTSTTRCTPTSVGGCTTWCDSDGVERTRSCEFRTETEYMCGTNPYTLGARKWMFRAPLSGLSAGDDGLEGSLQSHFEIAGKVQATGDLKGVDIVCRSDFKLKLASSLVSLIQLDCQQFSCSVAGEVVSCDQLQRALKDLSCAVADSSGGGGGDGGTVTNPPGGSCLDPDPGGRCQDFTGTGWITSIVQANCSSPNVYAETACATASRVGSCTIDGGQATESILRFYSPETSSNAQTQCGLASGVYTAD